MGEMDLLVARHFQNSTLFMGKLKAVRKGTGHPTSLCRRLWTSVPLTDTPPTYGIVYGTHLYLYLYTFYSNVQFCLNLDIHDIFCFEPKICLKLPLRDQRCHSTSKEKVITAEQTRTELARIGIYIQ